jgi:hypothetical protein
MFKTVLLALLILSVLTQVLVSAWFYDKLKMMDSRLSLYPVNKPVEVDLRVTIPELVEIDQKIEQLNQRLGKVGGVSSTAVTDKKATRSQKPPKVVKKTPKPRRSTSVDVVERIGD